MQESCPPPPPPAPPMSSAPQIWYRDPWQLVARDRLGVFLPLPEMPLEEQLNATMRFAAYFVVVLAALRRDVSVLLLAALAALFTYCVYEAEARASAGRAALLERLNVEETGRRARPRCYASTRHNPFMNVLPTDASRFPNRPPACDLSDSSVRARVQKNFETGLRRADGDIYKRTASDRQYYTMPNTTLPHDQHSYAHWLYPLPKQTFKEAGTALQPARQQ